MTRRWPLLVSRGTTLVLAALGIAQAFLAGGFLSGYYDALTAHLYVGLALILFALLQAVAVVFLVRSGAPRSMLGEGFGIAVLLVVQALLGSFRILWLHVPLGVVMVIGLVHLASSVWKMPQATEVSVETA